MVLCHVHNLRLLLGWLIVVPLAALILGRQGAQRYRSKTSLATIAIADLIPLNAARYDAYHSTYYRLIAKHPWLRYWLSPTSADDAITAYTQYTQDISSVIPYYKQLALTAVTSLVFPAVIDRVIEGPGPLTTEELQRALAACQQTPILIYHNDQAVTAVLDKYQRLADLLPESVLRHAYNRLFSTESASTLLEEIEAHPEFTGQIPAILVCRLAIDALLGSIYTIAPADWARIRAYTDKVHAPGGLNVRIAWEGLAYTDSAWGPIFTRPTIVTVSTAGVENIPIIALTDYLGSQ